MKKLKNEELNRLNIEDFKIVSKNKIIIVLDNVRSLNNIGSVFRTSDAFKIESIYLCGITATPPNKEIHKTALGAENSVDWKYFTSTEEAILHLKNNGYMVIAIEQADKTTLLNNFNKVENYKYALIFGNEVEGVAQSIIDNSDSVIEIPQWGTKHSLNVSVTVGIVLWELVR